jgi:thiol-disulfide isomerase/thioredoxin
MVAEAPDRVEPARGARFACAAGAGPASKGGMRPCHLRGPAPRRPGLRLGLTLAPFLLAPLIAAAAGAPLSLRSAGPAEIAALPRQPGARATVINVWATWCVPCRQEMPELLDVARAYRDRGLRLALVSADFDGAAARRFLARRGVTGPAWLKSGGDQAFIDALDRRWTGSLPATFVYDRNGRLLEFWEGRADRARFETAARRALDESADVPAKEISR